VIEREDSNERTSADHDVGRRRGHSASTPGMANG
jgi:hypothetical protein